MTLFLPFSVEFKGSRKRDYFECYGENRKLSSRVTSLGPAKKRCNIKMLLMEKTPVITICPIEVTIYFFL